MWHVAAAPLLARFDRSFVMHIHRLFLRTVLRRPSEVTPNVSEVILLLASIDDDNDRLNPCSSRSSCPVYVVVAPTYFPQATVTVEESWRKWRQLE